MQLQASKMFHQWAEVSPYSNGTSEVFLTFSLR
jgi:hypothetical protein